MKKVVNLADKKSVFELLKVFCVKGVKDDCINGNDSHGEPGAKSIGQVAEYASDAEDVLLQE